MTDATPTLLPDAVQRPNSAPAEGVIGAFDAGWNAHRVGLARETVQVLTPPDARAWALMAWDIRNLEAKRGT